MIRGVGRNALFNVIGTALSAIAGIFSVPVLINNIGESRLGVFTLVLGVIGFSGVFDLGLGRALTQSVAAAAGKGYGHGAIARHVRRTLPWIALLGGGWALALALLSDWALDSFFSFDPWLVQEARQGVLWLALAIPALLLSGSMLGVLEGLQKFALVNLLRVPFGILTFLAPAMGSFFWKDLGHIVALLALVRFIGVIVFAFSLCRELPVVRPETSETLDASGMWRFTGWLCVSNIVSPLMVHADRFYLASVFPPASVAYYTVPLDSIFRATSLPLTAMNALFPAFANFGVDSKKSAKMLRQSSLLMCFLWGIPLIIVSFIAYPLLRAWVGDAFALNALDITMCLLFGVMVNGFAHIPYMLIQSAGRSDVTAKIHLFEFPLYLFFIVYFVHIYGVLGAAVAWAIRMFVDAVLLYMASLSIFVKIRNEFIFSFFLFFVFSISFLSAGFIR